MKGYNFTERVRRVLARAREHARRLGHEYVGGEHMLLALLDEDDGIAIHAIRDLGADPQDLSATLERTLQRGTATGIPRDELPYTTRAKRAIELSMQQMLELHHDHVGAEHLLLGLIAEEKGIAAQVLHEAGITLDRAREEVARLVGGPVARPEMGSTAGARGRSMASGAMSGWVSVRGAPVEIILRQGDKLTRRTFDDIPAAIEFLRGEQPSA